MAAELWAMQLPDTADTIAAIATPPGVGAIAVLRVAGPDALTLVDSIFLGKKLTEQASHTAHFGRIVEPPRAAQRVVDEVLVTVFRGPKSYTGDDLVEISCHGSPFLQQQILSLLLRQGARLAQAGEFTLRAFLRGKLDLSQAEAVADLIASQSQASAEVALRQLRGGFRNEIQRLRDQLIHFASLIELELDFGEEDVEFANRAELRVLVERIREVIGSLVQSFSLGNALRTGVTTVLAGRPNAGKSTLLNALLNEERAIVSEVAGTTRDTIEEVLNIRGVQFRLVDTAGIREAQDAIEAIGVQRTLEKISQAAILVYVWDVAGGQTLAEVHDDLGRLTHASASALVVCNKMDRNPLFRTEWLLDPTLPDVHPYLLGHPPADPRPSTLNLPVSTLDLPPSHIIPISAKNVMNIEFLKEKLYEVAIGEGISGDQTIVTNARHHDALLRADTSLQSVLEGLAGGLTGDLVAQDIRHALAHLGEITGEIGVEDLLGSIFSKFCIGK
jgi:tRNA modification GTPase